MTALCTRDCNSLNALSPNYDHKLISVVIPRRPLKLCSAIISKLRKSSNCVFRELRSVCFHYWTQFHAGRTQLPSLKRIVLQVSTVQHVTGAFMQRQAVSCYKNNSQTHFLNY